MSDGQTTCHHGMRKHGKLNDSDSRTNLKLEQRRQKNTHAPCDNEKVSTTAISFPFIIPMTPPQTKQPAMDWRISALHITIPAPELLILT